MGRMTGLLMAAGASLIALGLNPAISRGAVTVEHELRNIVSNGPVGWTVDFQLPQASTQVGGMSLTSARVEANITLSWKIIGETTATGYYGAWPSWQTRIYSADGACCGGRTDGTYVSRMAWDGGGNPNFSLTGQSTDTFNMNDVTDSVELAKWAGSGLIAFTMDIYNPGMAYLALSTSAMPPDRTRTPF